MTRLLISGGSSYLGQHLVFLAIRRFQLCYTYFSDDPLGLPGGRRLDVRDGSAVQALVSEWRPDAIIHLAGSDRTADMDRVIRQGSQHITEAAERQGARLIHLSSDVIFDGQSAPYQESDPPSPIHAYGRAKAAAEEIVATHPDSVIVRTSLIYGLTVMDHATRWVVTTLRAGLPITLFEDQLRNPIWVESLSLACLELIASSYQGILNVAGRQAMSRAEFGLRMLDWWRVSARDFLSIGRSSGQWPRDCRLDTALAEQLLSTPLPGVDVVLEQHKRS